MALSNHERVGKAMEFLKSGLGPFIEREFKNLYKNAALAEAQKLMTSERLDVSRPLASWDVAALLRLMWDGWNDVFRKILGQAERTLVSELRDVRNKWAHQEPFSGDDAYRALDSTGRLLTAVSAKEGEEVEKMKMELLRVRFDEQMRTEKRKSTGTAIETQATGRHFWREVVSPHKDARPLSAGRIR
ncbi:MAG: Swt1 family HEPN domain-containing protein [Planctomycetota bacterium]